MDELLIRYLLNDLTPSERVEVELRLTRSPADSARLQSLRRVVRALDESAEQDSISPPVGLVDQTLAAVAEQIVARRLGITEDHLPEPEWAEPASHRIARQYREIHPHEFDSPLIPSWLRRVDVAAAACCAVVVGGLLLVGIEKLRHDSQVYNCQDQMRRVHQSLVSYSDTHRGQYPQVGSPTVPIVREFGQELRRGGHLAGETVLACPVRSHEDGSREVAPVNYAYTLGYRTPAGDLHGIERNDHPEGSSDWVPVAADIPLRQSTIHGNGQNILYTGGNVRFMTSPQAGYHGDDIYTNEAGLTRAGLHRNDTSLGKPTDAP